MCYWKDHMDSLYAFRSTGLLLEYHCVINYMLSASTGVDKGIKILSNINITIALAIMLFVILFGPTEFILETFVTTIGAYAARLPEMAFKLFPYEGLTGWSVTWTLTYLIWWLAWGPFVGVFIARISRGRTIREFCAGVILVPTLFSILWFAAFGGAAFYIELFGPGGLSELVAADVTDALFAFFDYFPFSETLSAMAVLLIFIFLVTSADSGTFVLSMMTTNGNLNPPVAHKFVWGILIAAITGATLLSGSVEVARAMAATGAIPFSAILLLQVVGLMRALREDRAEGPGAMKATGPGLGTSTASGSARTAAPCAQAEPGVPATAPGSIDREWRSRREQRHAGQASTSWASTRCCGR